MQEVAWILNLDAELDLAGDEVHERSTRQRARVVQQSKRFLAAAQAPVENITHRALRPDTDPSAICAAWCATRAARDIAVKQGFELAPGPSDRLLRWVNHRAFGTAIAENAGMHLSRSTFAATESEFDAHLDSHPWPTRGWLCKRPLGFSGRWRKHLLERPDEAQRRWISASMRDYGIGLLVEPFLHLDEEFALHGFLKVNGDCLRGTTTSLRCDDSGAWLGNVPAIDRLDAEETRRLGTAFAEVEGTLRAAEYLGPFSIDAYRWIDDAGERHFHPLSEINARYSMGFFTGIGDRQAEWLRCLRAS